MARSKTSRRRGGAWSDYINPRNWGKSAAEIEAAKAAKAAEEEAAKKEKCAAKKADYDKECGPGEASAADVPKETPVTDSEAPPVPKGARRRRQTRRKAKHRKGR
jgi:hypothetical protein